MEIEKRPLRPNGENERWTKKRSRAIPQNREPRVTSALSRWTNQWGFPSSGPSTFSRRTFQHFRDGTAGRLFGTSETPVVSANTVGTTILTSFFWSWPEPVAMLGISSKRHNPRICNYSPREHRSFCSVRRFPADGGAIGRGADLAATRCIGKWFSIWRHLTDRSVAISRTVFMAIFRRPPQFR